MSSPSNLGDRAFAATRVLSYSTATGMLYIRTSDTGTVASTSRTVDLAQTLHVGATGGKPLDATVHVRASGPPRWQGVTVSVAGEAVYHTSGLNTYITVAHKTRAATSGAGSTWRTLKSDVFRYKMGTDTDATFTSIGVVSGANLQAADRYYKANVTYSWKKASSTSAKDTTTSQELMINSGQIHLFGGDAPQNFVPYKVS